MASASVSDKIIVNFAWVGPNTSSGGSSRSGLDVRVVDLVFKGAKTKISVHLPENINPAGAQKFPFTCLRYHEMGVAKKTSPESLRVTIEQIHNFTVRVGLFEMGRPIGPKIMDSSTGEITKQQTVRRSDRDVRLEIPEAFEIGQTYSLVVSSDDLSLSARLIKEEKAGPTVQDESQVSRDEFQGRMKKMGESLIAEGKRNLELASNGGAGVFDSSSTSADVVAHVMRGVIRAGQEMHPEIRVPLARSSESPSELGALSSEELQLRFEATFKRDKEFEIQRMRAASAGNVEEMNRILQAELANSQLLGNLVEALERKGLQAQVPQSESFQSTAREAAELHAEGLKGLGEACNMQ